MAEILGQNTHNSESDDDHEDISVNEMCIYCKKDQIKFVTRPCRHKGACKKCAMRLATGGKCKTCKSMFVAWQSYVK